MPVVVPKPYSMRVAYVLIHMPKSDLSLPKINSEMNPKRPVFPEHDSWDCAHYWVIGPIQVFSDPSLHSEKVGVA